MTLKKKLSLLVFLTSVSIVSIGFSSWSITAESTAELNGNIQVDNVINSSECLKLNTTPQFFLYGERGFVDSNNKYVEKSIVEVNYVIDVAVCRTYFTNLNSINISIVLSHNEDIVFEDGKGLFDTYTVSNTDAYLSSGYNFETSVKLNDAELQTYNDEVDTNKNTISFDLSSYDFTSNPNSIALTIYYSWWIDGSTSYFNENIYTKIYDTSTSENKLKFVLESIISGN